MMMVRTRLQPTSTTGIGCFAEEDVSEGQVVWEFAPAVDRLVPLTEVEKLHPIARAYVTSHSSFDGKNCLLCYDHGTFINHSTNPNTRIEGDQTIATRNILAGEEITENYHEYDKDGPDKMNGHYVWE